MASTKKKPAKNAVLLATATESDALRPYVESLGLPLAAKATVLAIGPREHLEKLQAALPSTLAPADLASLSDVAWTLGWSAAWGDLIPTGFNLCALGGSLADAAREAKALKLQVRTAAEVDAVPRVQVTTFALAADLLDVDVARTKLAKLKKSAREAQLDDLVASVMGTEIKHRLAKLASVTDVGIEVALRLMQTLPEGVDVALLAGYEAPLRKESIPKSKDRDYLFNPSSYHGFVRRLVPLGGDFVKHTRAAARAVVEAHSTSITEGFLAAAEDLAGDGELALNRAFQLFVFQDEPDFMLFAPNLPGHDDPAASPLFLPEPGAVFTCECVDCRAYRMQVATRRLVALAPFESLSAETKELAAKVSRMKRSAPIASILEGWAPSLARPAAVGGKKRAKAKPTPRLDEAEAWLAKVQAAKTPAALKKLETELDGLEVGDLIDEDPARWEDLLRQVTDRRDTFGHGTKQQGILQAMLDTLSST